MSYPRKQWWVMGMAAVLAALLLLYNTGSWAAFGLCVLAIAALLVWHSSRTQKPRSIACVNCGEKLNPNARQCTACGSASWRFKN